MSYFSFVWCSPIYLQAYTKLVAYRAVLDPSLFLPDLMPTYIYMENSMATKLLWAVLGPMTFFPLTWYPPMNMENITMMNLWTLGFLTFIWCPPMHLENSMIDDEHTVSCVGPWSSSLLSDAHLCIRRTAWWWTYYELCWALGFLSFIWCPPMH